jgi:hypothetical protein
MMPRWFRPLSHPRDIKRVRDWIFNIKEPQGLDLKGENKKAVGVFELIEEAGDKAQ